MQSALKVHLLRDLSYLSFSVTQLSYLSFSADGLLRRLHLSSNVIEQDLHYCGIVLCLV